ncbi:MAG TPA: hypothetical protein VGI66_11685 [Streptosporangiaceae bacterium]|jgi:hypothetical protein
MSVVARNPAVRIIAQISPAASTFRRPDVVAEVAERKARPDLPRRTQRNDGDPQSAEAICFP